MAFARRTMGKLRGRGVPLGEAESATMGALGAEEAGDYFGERMEAIERMVVSAWKAGMPTSITRNPLRTFEYKIPGTILVPGTP